MTPTIKQFRPDRLTATGKSHSPRNRHSVWTRTAQRNCCFEGADVVAQRPPKRKKMSAEAGARIDAAQRAHCAKLMKRGEVDRKIFIIACTP